VSKPKILYFDIESAGVNALKSDLGFVIIFGFKWGHEKQAHTLTLTKNELRNFDDKALLKKACKLMEEADLLVGHFASVFDRRFIQGRLLIHGLPPIPFTKLRDTCMIARSVANFSSNRLKHLAKILHMRHQKLENNWPFAWFEVMKGNMTALDEMAEYCRGDVLALEELYTHLQRFDNASPRLVEDRSKCATCGGEVQYRGVAFVGQNKYRRFQCTKCGKWDRERRKMADVVDSEE
jgi:uncharacterized protein YprB with RNaseH-like and TPR domain